MERNMSRARRAFTEATKKRLKCWQAIFSKKPVRRCEPYSRRDVTAADPAAGARRIHDCGQGDSAWIATCLLSLVPSAPRSEEHTSELQSLMRISYAVFCLKKKNNKVMNTCTLL